MKKLFVTMLSVLACGAAYALPVGNPSDASLLCDGLFWEGNCCADFCDPCMSWCDAWSFRFGFYGDYVFNRHMQASGSRSDYIEDFELFTNAGYLAFNLFNRFDVFATLGATTGRLESNEATFQVFPVTDGRYEGVSSSEFSWSVGARATLWECGCTALGIEGQYFATKPRVNHITVHATDSVYTGTTTKYHEWQVGLGLSHRINMVVPYIAVKWSKAKFSVPFSVNILDGVAYASGDLKNGKHWGYAVGVTLVDCEKLSLTVEGRFGDEKAVHVNGQIRF